MLAGLRSLWTRAISWRCCTAAHVCELKTSSHPTPTLLPSLWIYAMGCKRGSTSNAEMLFARPPVFGKPRYLHQARRGPAVAKGVHENAQVPRAAVLLPHPPSSPAPPSSQGSTEGCCRLFAWYGPACLHLACAFVVVVVVVVVCVCVWLGQGGGQLGGLEGVGPFR